MPLELQPSRIVFQSASGALRHFDLGPRGAKVDVSGTAVIIDNHLWTSPQRRIVKFNHSGVLQIELLLASEAPVTIADDNRSYTIGNVRRTSASPILTVVEGDAGELVVLRRSDAPDPSRNLIRFNTDGTIRWQIGRRAFRPYDSLVGAEFLPNGNVRASAAPNGWSAEIDDRTGDVVQIQAETARVSG